ncbi:MAG: ATP-binding protein [Chitinophagaceae bacterium]
MTATTPINYQTLFENLPGLYMILDADLRILTASDAYMAATMTNPSVMHGRYLFDVFPDNPNDPNANGEFNLQASLRYVISSGQPHNMAVQKYDVRGPDGVFEERYWSCMNKPIFDAAGNLQCIVHRAEDVSEFVHIKNQQAREQLAAEGMQQRVEEMESEVYNRAREIQRAEVALQEKSRLLEKANKELETFSYSVSHDLRAPLRIIDGYTEIAVKDYGSKLDDEGRRILGIIASNVRRMGQLIDDLLNLSRMSRKELEIHHVNMDELVKSILAEQLGDTDKYTVRLSPLLPAACDRNLIAQVWINLVSNAIKYASRNEHPEIEIDCYVSGNEQVYRVKDNGVGFNMKYVGKLFGVFQRLHKMTEFEGTGVGLAIVQQIVSRHGGRVWAEAETGKGACFFFSLPIQS